MLLNNLYCAGFCGRRGNAKMIAFSTWILRTACALVAIQMTPAVALLKKHKQQFQLHSYSHDPAAASYGLEAADKLGLQPQQVFKTLVALADTGELLVAVLPVVHTLNMKKLATAAGVKKVAMADPKQVERTTGYVLGGVSPLGQKKNLRTFIDQSARDFDSLFCSAGRRGLEIELAPDLLQQLTRAQWAELVATD